MVTERDGTIRVFDYESQQEISLLNLTVDERKKHFEALFDVVCHALPDKTEISSWLSTIRLIGQDKKVLGELEYVMTAGEMIINKMSSEVSGGGRAMLLRALLNHPQTEGISSKLALDNKVAYITARARGVSPEQALKQTPAYKIRAFCGYNRIMLENQVNEDNLELVTESLPKIS